jgi:hypothetical protein
MHYGISGYAPYPPMESVAYGPPYRGMGIRSRYGVKGIFLNIGLSAGRSSVKGLFRRIGLVLAIASSS